MRVLLVLLWTASAFGSPTFEITHLQHQIHETQDRILVAEDRMADEDLALVKDRKILNSLKGLAGAAGSARKLKEAQLIVDTHTKKRLEWASVAAAEQAQLTIWKLHLDRAKGIHVPDATLEESYRTLWDHRAAQYERMRETWLLKHAYESEHYQALEALARSGAISQRALMESDFRVKEALHEADLSQRRAESAGKFLR